MNTVIDFDANPSTLVPTVIEAIYVGGKHDCCDLDEFDPDECPDCLGCGHCSTRHQDLPVGRGVCDVPGCECFHLTTGDDCDTCSGTGTVADNNDREYECPKCGGHGVTS